MRRIAAAGGAIAVLAGAAAADGPLPAPGVYQYPPAIRLYSWNGLYIGGHVGAGWSDDAGSDSDGGFLGGAQVGFNVRTGRAVFGLEAQLSGIGRNGDDGALVALPGGATATFEGETDWLATLTARAGIAWDRSLLYLKGGAAWTQNSYRASLVVPGLVVPGATSATTFEGDDTRSGWVLGAGYEHAFRSAWSARLEYLFMDFGSESIALNGPTGGVAVADIDQRGHALTLSVNYRFDWPIAGPLGTPE